MQQSGTDRQNYYCWETYAQRIVNSTYQLGLLLVIFGGFLTMNSTGEITYLAIIMMFLGLLTGILGIAMSSGSRRENLAE